MPGKSPNSARFAPPTVIQLEGQSSSPGTYYSTGSSKYDRIFNSPELDSLTPLQKEFLRERWLGQIGWFSKRAKHNQVWYHWIRLFVIIGSVIVPVLLSWGSVPLTALLLGSSLKPQNSISAGPSIDPASPTPQPLNNPENPVRPTKNPVNPADAIGAVPVPTLNPPIPAIVAPVQPAARQSSPISVSPAAAIPAEIATPTASPATIDLIPTAAPIANDTKTENPFFDILSNPAIQSQIHLYRMALIVGVGLSQLVAICAAIEQFFKFGDRWRHYRLTAELLKMHGWQFFELSGPYAAYGEEGHAEAFSAFANQVEAIIQNDVDGYVSQIATPKQLGADRQIGLK